jgi:hypothetical protein
MAPEMCSVVGGCRRPTSGSDSHNVTHFLDPTAMSTGSGSSSHSRFGSSSSTSSINSLSDTRHSPLYPEYHPNSYPSSSLHMERPNSNINLQTSLGFEMPDNMGRNVSTIS